MTFEKYNEINIKLGLQYSKTVMKEYAKSFYFANKLLPKDKREASYSVYTFCRYADNIVDNPRKRESFEIVNEINALKNELELAYKYGESEHPALSAFVYYATKYKIPKEYPFDLLDGVMMDTTHNSYDNFDELYVFCYKVASVVGLMMTYVLGFKDDNALIYAEKMGIGMQLTNILRDIKEDKKNNRIYLPKSDLKEFNVSEEDIYNENFNDNFKKLIQYYIDKAESYYIDSYNGIPLLHKDARFSIITAGRIYAEILSNIKENDFNPFGERVYVSKNKKYSIMLQEILNFKR
ncbi:MAG: phytoene/squalene synthase family protein [Candidatus Kapaibacteriota bacterium]|jgi:phytoene synthase